MEIELLPPALATPARGDGITLRGEAARSMRDALSTTAVAAAKVGHRASQTTYRLVPPDKAAKGLANGTLEWSANGSTLIRDKATGQIAAHGKLTKVKPTVGPMIAWEVAAMAVQQHYLVEINDKLAGIEKGVGEALQRMDDDKRGTLKQLRKVVDATQQDVAEGREPSSGRQDELRRAVRKADDIWHQLNERVARHLEGYRAGTSTADEVEDAWGMLLFATQVLGEAGATVINLPFDSLDAMQATNREEQQRVTAAVDEVRRLAGELHAAHLDWSRSTAEYNLRRTRNPAKTAARAVRKELPVKPLAAPLRDVTAWRASQLAAPPQPVAALLVSVEDDRIEIAAERPSAARLV